MLGNGARVPIKENNVRRTKKFKNEGNAKLRELVKEFVFQIVTLKSLTKI